MKAWDPTATYSSFFLSSPLTLHFTWEHAYGLPVSDSTAFSTKANVSIKVGKIFWN